MKALSTLVSSMAARFQVPEGQSSEIIQILKATCFKPTKSNITVTDSHLFALMVVANQYGLNPWTKEIYAYPDKNQGIVPVVGVDGWSRIINEHQQFDGMEFNYSDQMVSMPECETPIYEWVECVMYRKDRTKPTIVREYADECYRPPFEGTNDNGSTYKIPGPWQSHGKRLLRHKSVIQCARYAFGFVGVYDQDEAERIVGGTVIDNETGEITQQAEAVKKPQRKPPADAQDVAESEAGEAGAEGDKADQSQKTEPVKKAEPGQLKWIEQKCKSLNLDVVETLGNHGLTSLDEVTSVNFQAIRSALMAL